MEFSQFHFSEPLWLWVVATVPIVWLLYLFFYKSQASEHKLEKFIDPHLLKYLLVNPDQKKRSLWGALLLWSLVITSLAFAMAGPRWDFREVESFSRDQSLVILLDLSQSMEATDIKPSRLIRAKQKIEDLLNLSKGVKIGLIAYAADPHMITPLTDDIETIRHFAPYLGNDLVHIQGSRLKPALEMASSMLEAANGTNKAILAISDGGFEDASAINAAKQLADKGIPIYTLGVGTVEGAPIKDREGNFIKKGGALVLSKLEKEKMQEISAVSGGRYLEAHFRDHAEEVVLGELEKRAEAEEELSHTTRFWDEHFYFWLFPVLPIILWWFRKGSLIAALLLLTPWPNLTGAEVQQYFKNSEQRGIEALEQGDYESAINLLEDPYRKGIAYYKAGNYEQAEEQFRQSSRPEVASSAEYNLGNALAQQEKYQEAMKVYKEVINEWPEHTKAKENLETIKQILEQQQQNKQESNDSEQKEDKDGEQSNEGDKQPDEEKDDSSNQSNGDEKNNDENRQSESDEESKSNDNEPKPPQEDENASDDAEQKPDEDNKPQQQNGEEENAGNDTESQAPQNDEEGQIPPPAEGEEEVDADQWLNRLSNHPKNFMKNKFYIESKKMKTKETIEPW